MKKYSPVAKSFSHRLFELSQSLLVIRDSIESMKKGQIHQIIPMSGQLRALLAEKRRGNKPLLLTIAKELKEELNIYAMVDVDLQSEGLIFSMSGFPVSLEQELPGQKMSTLEGFIDREIITYGSFRYSMRDIIEFYACKAGGAHYDPDMSQDFIDLLTINIGGYPSIARALLQFGEVVFKLGHRLFKTLVDTEIHLLLLIPQKVEEGPAYVFDFKHPKTPMRVFCNVRPGIRPGFGVRGLSGNSATVVIERLIDWTTPHHVMFSIEVEDDLATSLSVYVDGERAAKATSTNLLLIYNDLSTYDLYLNRSADNPKSGLIMAWAHLIVYNLNHTALDRAKSIVALNGMLSEDEVPCTYLSEGAYAHLGPRQKVMEYFGDYILWDMKKLTRSELPVFAKP